MPEPSPTKVNLEIDNQNPEIIYFDCPNAQNAKSMLISEWDLAFDCRKNGFSIRINNEKELWAANLGSRPFENDLTDIHKIAWTKDQNEELYKGNVLGDWGDFNYPNPQSFQKTYVLGIGKKPFKISDLVKIQVLGCKEGKYKIRLARVGYYKDTLIHVPKDAEKNFVFLSLKTLPQFLNNEPEKNTWDFSFSPILQKVHIGPQDSLWLKTENFLLNPNGRKVWVDTTRTFEEITYFNLGNPEFKTRLTALSPVVLQFNLLQNHYLLNPKAVVIISSPNGEYYKIKFLAFEKGTDNKTKVTFLVKNM